MGLFDNLFGGISRNVTWYCDCCNAVMNNQPGFNTSTGKWECTKCGEINDVSSNNIYATEEEYQEAMGIPRCPQCGGMVVGDAPDALIWFNCPTCGDRFILENGELINVRHWHKGSSKTCVNCGQSMSGGEYVAPWENGNNPDGYIKCPHCGYVNFEWDE